MPYNQGHDKEIMGPYTENIKVKVPKGSLFVLGDNRRNSTDSRHIGFISIDKVVGKTNVVYWPINEFQFIK